MTVTKVNVPVMENVIVMESVLVTVKAVCVTITQVELLIVLVNAQVIVQPLIVVMIVQLSVLATCVKTVRVMGMFVCARINVLNLIIVLDTVLVMENVLVML